MWRFFSHMTDPLWTHVPNEYVQHSVQCPSSIPLFFWNMSRTDLKKHICRLHPDKNQDGDRALFNYLKFVYDERYACEQTVKLEEEEKKYRAYNEEHDRNLAKYRRMRAESSLLDVDNATSLASEHLPSSTIEPRSSTFAFESRTSSLSLDSTLRLTWNGSVAPTSNTHQDSVVSTLDADQGFFVPTLSTHQDSVVTTFDAEVMPTLDAEDSDSVLPVTGADAPSSFETAINQRGFLKDSTVWYDIPTPSYRTNLRQMMRDGVFRTTPDLLSVDKEMIKTYLNVRFQDFGMNKKRDSDRIRDNWSAIQKAKKSQTFQAFLDA